MNAPIINLRAGGGGDADQGAPTETHRGQLRFAERFVREHDGRLLHVHGLGWHQYDGARWAECTDGAETRAVRDTIDTALGDLRVLDGDARRDLMKDIAKVESAAGMSGVLDIAGKLHPCTVAAEEMDKDPYLFNTASGTVDLRTNHVRAARPADHISKVTEAKFDPEACSEVFDEFLATVQPDPETRAFIARSLGSALIGLVREQRLLIWFGTGANGKGTLRDAIRSALGDYSIEVPADVLLASQHGQQALAPERMRLKGTRVAFCSEIAAGARMDEATMKKLTGGDPVNAKLLYRNPVEFDPSHTLFMLTNHLPVVRGDDPAVWRRILAVPFDQVIPPEARDPELPEKLKACPEAVMAWVWRGWLDYCAQGLNPPEAVLAATRKYEQDSDLLARFLSEESGQVVHGHGSIGSAALYKAFTDWARSEGESADMTNKAFTTAMEKRGFSRTNTRAGAVWKQLMLASKDD